MVRCINPLPCNRLRRILLATVSALLIPGPAAGAEAAIPLSELSLLPIAFQRIKPNTVHFGPDLLQIEVDQSASFLLHAFDEIRNVRRVSFRWRSCGSLNKLDAEHEASKAGDDAWLRIGLIQKGEAQLLNPLAPSWVKQVAETLRFPGGSMLYLVAGAEHDPGERWPNPYSSDVTMIAAEDRNSDADGWKLAEHRFGEPVQIVGLWIMADGDNTMSTFTTQLKDLLVE